MSNYSREKQRDLNRVSDRIDWLCSDLNEKYSSLDKFTEIFGENSEQVASLMSAIAAAEDEIADLRPQKQELIDEGYVLCGDHHDFLENQSAEL